MCVYADGQECFYGLVGHKSSFCSSISSYINVWIVCVCRVHPPVWTAVVAVTKM